MSANIKNLDLSKSATHEFDHNSEIANLHKLAYGRYTVGNANLRAHRVAFFLGHGFIAHHLQVCHRCDNPTCVNPDHLFLGTQQDNIEDRNRKGRARKKPVVNGVGHAAYHSGKAYGERSGSAKFKDADVLAIRRLIASGESYTNIARRYQTSISAISRIGNGRNYKHVVLSAG